MKKLTVDELAETARELQRIAMDLESGKLDRLLADTAINAHGKFIKAFAEQSKWELLHGHAKKYALEAKGETLINDTASRL